MMPRGFLLESKAFRDSIKSSMDASNPWVDASGGGD